MVPYNQKLSKEKPTTFQPLTETTLSPTWPHTINNKSIAILTRKL